MLWLFAVLGNLALSLSVAWIAYREMLAPETLLDLGLLYEVAQALCISRSSSIDVRSGRTSLPRGWTAVAVWILAYPAHRAEHAARRPSSPPRPPR